MSSYQQGSTSGEGRGGMEFLFFGLLLVMLMVGMWLLIRQPLLWISFYVSYYCFKAYAFVADFLPFLMTKAENKELLMAIKHIPQIDPTKHGWSALMTMFKIHGYIGRWILIPLTLWWGWATYKGVVRFKYKRRIGSVYDMINIQSKFFPASAIIKGKNLLKTHPYSGPWATYALPLDFALDNEILWAGKEIVNEHSVINEKKMFPIPPFTLEQKVLGFPHKRKLMPAHHYVTFNYEKCSDAFTAQLGPKWNGHKSLPPLEKALYAIFCTQIAGEQGEAWKMVEQIAFSWREGAYDKKGKLVSPFLANTKGVDELIKKYSDSKEVRRIERLHYHKNNVLQALLGSARKKGRLMHSNILWVKPMNRALWYCLCGEGGQVAYWEAAGPWAHAQVERLMGRAVAVPMVAGAVIAFNTLMSREHWIDPGEFSEDSQRRLVQEANDKIEEAKAEAARSKGNGGSGAQDAQRRQQQQRERQLQENRQKAARNRRKEDDEP